LITHSSFVLVWYDLDMPDEENTQPTPEPTQPESTPTENPISEPNSMTLRRRKFKLWKIQVKNNVLK